MARFRGSDWEPIAAGVVIGFFIYISIQTARADYVSDQVDQFEPVEIETAPVMTSEGWFDMTEEQLDWFILGTRTGWKNSQKDFLKRCLNTDFKIIEFHHKNRKVEIMCFERR